MGKKKKKKKVAYAELLEVTVDCFIAAKAWRSMDCFIAAKAWAERELGQGMQTLNKFLA